MPDASRQLPHTAHLGAEGMHRRHRIFACTWQAVLEDFRPSQFTVRALGAAGVAVSLVDGPSFAAGPLHSAA
jgi:hypothetical protein